jgi:hypothetical protein
MMADYMSAADAHDAELILRLLLHYTDEQIAEIWERQLIPNALIDDVRVAAHEQGLAYVGRLLDEDLRNRGIRT